MQSEIKWSSEIDLKIVKVHRPATQPSHSRWIEHPLASIEPLPLRKFSFHPSFLRLKVLEKGDAKKESSNPDIWPSSINFSLRPISGLFELIRWNYDSYLFAKNFINKQQSAKTLISDWFWVNWWVGTPLCPGESMSRADKFSPTRNALQTFPAVVLESNNLL